MSEETVNYRIDDLSAGMRDLLAAVDRLQTTVAANTVVLERNTTDLEKHIRRTDQLEALVSDLVIPMKVLKFVLIVAGGLATATTALFALRDLFAAARNLF